MENAKKLTESTPQTTIPTTIKETNEPSTQTEQATSTKIASSNDETTSKLIIFEKTTTSLPVTEESAIPEAESDRPEDDVKWVTATPQTGPKIVTEIVEIESTEQTTSQSVAQQNDNTAVTAENPPITVFNRGPTTIQPDVQTTTVEEKSLETEGVTEPAISSTGEITESEISSTVGETSSTIGVTQEVTQPQTTIAEETSSTVGVTQEVTQEVTQPQTTIAEEETQSTPIEGNKIFV